jgi:hypothetical protein
MPDNPQAHLCRCSAAPSLALRPAQAARAIGVSARALWSMTKAGQVPHAVLSRSTYTDAKGNQHERELVVYPVAQLTAWLAGKTQARAEAPQANPGAEAVK